MIIPAETTSITEHSWQKRALKAEALVIELQSQLEQLKEQVNLLTAKRYGASSEKTHKDQLSLFDDVFNEAEATAEPFAPEPELTTVAEHKRAKTNRGKGASLEDLPEHIIEYHLPEAEMVCTCGHRRHIIGQEVSRELHHIPAQLYIDVHVQNVYGCRYCEAHGDGSETVIATAPKPKRAFPGSIASPSVVAHVIEEKYVMGVPLYRQEQQWARRGVPLSRQNMSNWIMYAAENWFEPIYNQMKGTLLKQDILHADETGVQVLKEKDKKAESKSFMWLYRSGRYGPGIVLYEYQPSRAREHPKQFLQGFKGYLITDGYAGYGGLPDVVNVGCWAHAKRGFQDAIKASGGSSKSPKALEGLKYCNQLFRIERDLKILGPEERYERRLERSKPVLEALLVWLNNTKKESVPQSYLGKSIQYCLNQWEPLTAFLLDGRLEIDNNRSERSIKPFVISRKNFLFCITPRGAKASAITFSLVESAKENGLKPFDYLEYLLSELPNATTGNLHQFMPWSDSIPAHCRTRKGN